VTEIIFLIQDSVSDCMSNLNASDWPLHSLAQQINMEMVIMHIAAKNNT